MNENKAAEKSNVQISNFFLASFGLYSISLPLIFLMLKLNRVTSKRKNMSGTVKRKNVLCPCVFGWRGPCRILHVLHKHLVINRGQL